MQIRIMSTGVLVLAALAVAATSRAGAAGGRVRGQILVLVEEFKVEQAGADAALARGFAGEVGGRVDALLSEASTRAGTDVARLGQDVGALVEERLRGAPAWDQAANQRLSALIVDRVAGTRTALDAIGPEVRARLTSELGALGRQYVARRNAEMAARIMRYVGRVKALMAEAAQMGQAEVKQAIDRAVAEFRAKIQAGIKPPAGVPRWPVGPKGPTSPRAAPAIRTPAIRRP